MPVDLGIYSSALKPVKSVLDFQSDYDAADGRAQTLQQNRLALLASQQANADDQTLRAATAASGGDLNKLYAATSGAGLYKQAAEIRKQQDEQSKNKAAVDKDRVEIVNKKVSLYRDGIANINDPQTAAQYVQALHQDPDFKGTAITAVPLDQVLAKIPTDPAGLQRWKQEFALGATKFMELNKPTISTRNLGGKTDTIATEGLTGATRTVNSAVNTQSPDSVASNAVQYARLAEDKRHHGQVEGAAADAAKAGKWQYDSARGGMVNMQTQEFRPALEGGVPIGAKQKDLKSIPPAQNAAIIENAKALQNIDAAIAAIKADPGALGLQNVLGEGVMQRMDKKGVDPRAKVAMIGSQKYHDLSGANVTASESPRLSPFIPSARDNAEVALTKLENLRREYSGVTDMLSQTYSEDQGYRPSPVKVPTPADPGGGKLTAAESAELAALRKRFGK